MSTQPETSFRFDEFELHPGRRSLSRLGEKIPLAPKTFDVLTCLVANPGRVVTKEELIKSVWQGALYSGTHNGKLTTQNGTPKLAPEVRLEDFIRASQAQKSACVG